MYFNISLHIDIICFDQKANVWLIYVCIYVIRMFNISLHNGISFFDQKTNVWLIYVSIHVLSILAFHTIMA